MCFLVLVNEIPMPGKHGLKRKFMIPGMGRFSDWSCVHTAGPSNCSHAPRQQAPLHLGMLARFAYVCFSFHAQRHISDTSGRSAGWEERIAALRSRNASLNQTFDRTFTLASNFAGIRENLPSSYLDKVVWVIPPSTRFPTRALTKWLQFVPALAKWDLQTTSNNDKPTYTVMRMRRKLRHTHLHITIALLEQWSLR